MKPATRPVVMYLAPAFYRGWWRVMLMSFSDVVVWDSAGHQSKDHAEAAAYRWADRNYCEVVRREVAP